jgi:hypothetical protein
MSDSSPGEDRLKKRPLTPSEYAARDCDLQQAKIEAHQAYLAGLNPDSLKAEDARRQIQLLREELQIKLDRADGG